MDIIATPRLIAIDTSILGKIAEDYKNKNSKRREKALNFLSIITNNGLIPLFCMHHFQEILQHENDVTVSNRFSLIKRLPQVAWIKPSTPEGLIGSIIEIQGTELLKLIKNPEISTNTLIEEVKQELIEYSTGELFINNIEETLLQLRDLNLFGTQKNKAISTICHIVNPKISNIKLSSLHHSKLIDLNNVNKSMQSLKSTFKQEMDKRGDSKLENKDEVIDQFIYQVIKDGLKMYKSNSESLYINFINSHGIEEHEVNENWTISDLGYYSTFKEQIKVIKRTFNLDMEKALKIPQSAIPSWFIWVELDKKIIAEKYASGSNVIDKYLASLSVYADIFIADKRVKEYFKQIAQKNNFFAKIDKHVIKLSDYEDLENQLHRR